MLDGLSIQCRRVDDDVRYSAIHIARRSRLVRARRPLGVPVGNIRVALVSRCGCGATGDERGLLWRRRAPHAGGHVRGVRCGPYGGDVVRDHGAVGRVIPSAHVRAVTCPGTCCIRSRLGRFAPRPADEGIHRHGYLDARRGTRVPCGVHGREASDPALHPFTGTRRCRRGATTSTVGVRSGGGSSRRSESRISPYHSIGTTTGPGRRL